MEIYQRPLYYGILREEARKVDQKIAGEIGYQKAGRSWNELSFLAADRQKWKELVDNLRSK
jgi:hypothetical protein